MNGERESLSQAILRLFFGVEKDGILLSWTAEAAGFYNI